MKNSQLSAILFYFLKERENKNAFYYEFNDGK